MKKLLLTTAVSALYLSGFPQQILAPTQINVFKNGTYFIQKEGIVSPKAGKLSLEVPNQPLLGTYWINTPKETKVSKVVFETDTLKKLMTARDIPEVVFANKGKKVKVGYKTDDKTYREISGVLQDYFKTSGMLKIKSPESKTMYILISNVIDFTVEEIPADKMEADSLTRLAKIEFSKNTESLNMKLVYMQTGIQWIPSYNIKLLSDKELQLEMKALIENSAEAVDNADLTLTVGNPQFFYGYTVDPLSEIMQTNISTLYGKQSNVRSAMLQTNTYAVQAYGGLGSTDASNSTSYDYNDYSTYTTEGEKTNDLYMYKLGKVSLAKNTKTSFQIFSSTFSYKDVYEVDLYDVVNYSYNRNVGNDPEQKFDVYHSFKITNSSTNPLTTAPVFVMDENLQPLAQDQMKYTPVGSDVSVQLSRASDVIVKNTEEEVLKTETTKKYGNETYVKVQLKGSVLIENLQDKKINLNVDKSLTAEITEASDSGKIKKTGKYYALNPYSEINWEVPLAAKEKKTITYSYEVWVRSK